VSALGDQRKTVDASLDHECPNCGARVGRKCSRRKMRVTSPGTEPVCFQRLKLGRRTALASRPDGTPEDAT